MSRLHGILLVRKPKGITSHDVVSQIRRNLSLRDVGHAGTLDPLAEGLMVLMLGEATKMSSYILEQDKQYVVELKLGEETDTLDKSGVVTQKKAVSLDSVGVVAHAQKLVGDFNWEIPLYSAKKIDGKKLYEQARKGVLIEQLPIKPMKFWDVEFLGASEAHHYLFRIRCSKGSFIRTWVQQLGKELGCGAVMTELTRTFSAPYSLEQAKNLNEISVESVRSSKSFIPILSALPSFKTVRVGGHSEGLIRNGQISHDLRRHLIALFNPEQDEGVKILSQRPEELLALIGLEKNRGFVVRRVFKY